MSTSMLGTDVQALVCCLVEIGRGHRIEVKKQIGRARELSGHSATLLIAPSVIMGSHIRAHFTERHTPCAHYEGLTVVLREAHDRCRLPKPPDGEWHSQNPETAILRFSVDPLPKAVRYGDTPRLGEFNVLASLSTWISCHEHRPYVFVYDQGRDSSDGNPSQLAFRDASSSVLRAFTSGLRIADRVARACWPEASWFLVPFGSQLDDGAIVAQGAIRGDSLSTIYENILAAADRNPSGAERWLHAMLD